jgi:hypothetical protein
VALFHIQRAAVFGIDAHLIDVEVDIYAGGNARDFITVGMPGTSVRESRERIKSALMNSGFRVSEQVGHDQPRARERAEGTYALGAGELSLCEHRSSGSPRESGNGSFVEKSRTLRRHWIPVKAAAYSSSCMSETRLKKCSGNK